MNKLIFTVLIIFGFLLLKTNNVLAISGACSRHSGVNCSTGPSILNGNAVCNDGTSSGVAYSSMDECNDSMFWCSNEEWSQLKSKHNTDELQNKVKDLNNQIEQLNNSYQSRSTDIENKPIPMQFITGQQAQIQKQYSVQSSNLVNQAQLAQSDYYSAFYTAYHNCWQLGRGEYWKKISFNNNSSLPPTSLSDNFDVNIELQKYCIKTQGVNSVYNSNTNSCDCISGYSKNLDFQCLPEKQAVQEIEKVVSNYKKKVLIIEKTIISKEALIIKPKDSKVIPNITAISNQENQPIKKTTEIILSVQTKNTTVPINTEPVIKVSWYQKIFNWLFK